MPKHAAWAAAQSGKPAWIIDCEYTEEKWFDYTCHTNIKQIRYVRRKYCEKLREGKAL